MKKPTVQRRGLGGGGGVTPYIEIISPLGWLSMAMNMYSPDGL